MTIQISGTTVIDQNRYIQNIQAYYGPGIATQAEAESGTNNDQLMTPLRVKQSVLNNGLTTVINRIQRGQTTATSGAQYAPSSTSIFTVPAITNVPVTSVNTGKSFVSGTVQSAILSGGPGGTFYTGACAGRLTSATNLEVRTVDGTSGRYNPYNSPQGGIPYPASVSTGVLYWEVIEFK